MSSPAPIAWQFYGRSPELDKLTAILRRNRWFFAKITGRRRIGKTSLVHEALRRSNRSKVLYVQVPDSDPAGVLATVRDFYDLFGVPGARPFDLRTLAQDIARLVRDGWVVALDEFQYFHRSALYEFTSHLQFEVDRLAAQASSVTGGLIVLGSIHTEMAALLEDRAAPLFNRITDELPVSHLDIGSVLDILRAHAEPKPERLLFLWNLFEGVPKFYRDCFEQGVLAAPRAELLETMFFSSSSPLRHEADNWFLRSWLAALQTATAAVHFRPVPQLVAGADAKLAEAEGHGLERLVARLYEERSRKGLGDFSLTHRIEGFWDKADRGGAQVEIDLVALDEDSQTIRLGTCKRDGAKLAPDLPRFDRHIDGFLRAVPRFRDWTVQRVAIAPTLSTSQRAAVVAAGYMAQDVGELLTGL